MSRSSKGFLLSDVGGVKECLQYVCRTNSARLVAILVNGQAWSKFSHLSTAAEKCAKWRRNGVPVGLIKKGLEALLIDARCEPRGA